MPHVIAIFEDSSQARQAIERMTNDRVEADRIGLLARDAEPDSSKAPSGGLVGTLSRLGVPQEDAANYDEQVRQGKTLVTVRAADDTEADRVANLMEVEGAVEVEGAGERGNEEAAPGYEGARAEEDSRKSSARQRRAPDARDRRRNFRAPGGRIRVFGS